VQVRKTTSITLADHLSCLAFFHGDHDLRRPILLQRWRTLLPRQRAPRQRNSLSVMRQVQVLTRARRQMRSSPIPSESSVHNQPILILLKPTFLGRLGFHDVLYCIGLQGMVHRNTAPIRPLKKFSRRTVLDVPGLKDVGVG
jgi:hypothetical protein